MKKFIDPPEGWKYGFPKQIPNHVRDTITWLVNNGYPEEKIKEYGEQFYCRYWTENNEYSDLAKAVGSLVDSKNEKYGNAVLEPLEIFSGKCKAGDRMDDKVSRIKNSDELRTNDVVDLIGYLLITLKEMDVTEEDINNLID